MTNHPPGYTGHIPASNLHFGIAAEHAKAVQPRKTFLKENISENL